MAGRWYDRPGRPASRFRRDLPTHFALTDPQRFADTLAFADNIPEGWGVIYRHFGASDRGRVAARLAEIARARGWLFLVAADPELAALCGADGVHWPEKQVFDAVRWRRSHRDSVMTVSAHSRLAVRKATQGGADAVFLSPVRTTSSPGSGQALGWQRAGSIARSARTPIYALGGITQHDIHHACRLGFSGIAMISGVIA